MSRVRRLSVWRLQALVMSVSGLIVGAVAITVAVLSGQDRIGEDLAFGAAGAAGAGLGIGLELRKALRKARPLADDAIIESNAQTIRREVVHVLVFAGIIGLGSDLIGAALMGAVAVGLGLVSGVQAAALRRWEEPRGKRVFRERGFRWTPRYYTG